MTDWVVLVNRRAGRHPVALDDLRSALDEGGVSARLSAPESTGEMRGAIREAGLEGRAIAVAGGDGTVGLAADVLVGLELETPALLGVIPTGTGSDLMRTFGVTGRAAVDHLRGEDAYTIDAGRVTGKFGSRVFVNVAQAGVGAAAAESAPRLSRRLGSARYPLAFAGRLPRFPRCRVVVEGGRGFDGEALAVVFANAQFFAGGWNVAPRATLVDGVLDVQVFGARKREAPRLVPRIIQGTHLSHPSVRRMSVGDVTVTSDVPWPVETDGDYVGRTPVRVTCLPAAIRLKI